MAGAKKTVEVKPQGATAPEPGTHKVEVPDFPEMDVITEGPGDQGPHPAQQASVAPRVAAAMRTAAYGNGEGFEAGNLAPKTLYLDRASGEVVESPPEQGKVLAIKGDVVSPVMARRLEALGYKG